ncbi:MAG: ComF family protein [Gammaproteobacteria bacterium]|nr:ComF family protein [Gammaproteobacteria bacterium]MDE0367227.1 ComF family protein [Gammaproteobacteria bacterium]
MGITDWWFPRVCRLCRREMHRDIDLCAPCEKSLAWNRNACSRCGVPLPGVANGTCTDCAGHPPPFEATVTPLLYEGPIRGWVHAAKSARGLGEAKLLSGLLARGIEFGGARIPDALVPVPLTTARLFRRGHNQAALLAAPLSRRLCIPLRRGGIARAGGSRPQRGQSRSARARSVRSIFRATRSCTGHLAIVDDVVTTGATAGELAATLLDAGAGRVDVWAVARVPPVSGIN